MDRIRAVLLDVDGTLVDSNDAHGRAWVDVGRELGYAIHFEDVRPLIGMGSDKVVPVLTGHDRESPEGSRAAELHGEIFRNRYLPDIRVFHGTHDLLEHMQAAGLTLVVATSAGSKDLHAILEHAGLKSLIDAHTTSSEAKDSKPDADIVLAALEKAGAAANAAVFIGDTPYDVEAGRRAHVACVALRCGGWWSDHELAAAVAIYDDPAHLLESWEASLFGPPHAGRTR